eukprot:gene5600-6968_t
MWSYILSFFNWLGFFKKEGRVVFLGLGNAGKTTFLNKLVTGRLQVHAPTQRPNQNSFKIGAVELTAVDMGGQANLRRIWRNYLQDRKTMIIFMADSADTTSMNESISELHDILQDETLQYNPILILGSKFDLRDHLSRDQFIASMNLNGYRLGTFDHRPIDVKMFSSVTGEGIPEILDWLSKCSDL